MKNLRNIFLTVAILLLTMIANGKVRVPHFFSDNMVLQRDMPVKIWGYAGKNEPVAVSLNGSVQKTTAGKDGKWSVELPAMTYGGPYQVRIDGRDNSIILDNVLIGDVWLCSGQSNMEFNLNGDLTAQEAIQNSANSNIRLLTIPKTIQTRECDNTEETTWMVCDPSTSANFSAVGYFFGKKLQEELRIPVGLINSSWGGTDIETWTSWEASMNNSEYAPFKGQTLENAIGYTSSDVERFKQALENDPALDAKWYDLSTKVKGWKKMQVPQAWNGDLENEDGIIWFRKEIELPADADGSAGTIQLGAIDDEDITWINGQQVGSMGLWIANRNYSITPGILKAGKNIIMVRVKDTGSTGGMFGVAEQLYFEVNGTRYPLAGEWDYKPSVLSSSFGFKAYGSGPNSFASLLYNGMIHPLVGYGIRGVIWYQGENNSGEAYRYRSLFPNMITDWRKQWGYEFPFLWVQLASFMALDDQPKDSEWAELREAQNMTLSLPKTGQAVITDIGEAFDIHPRNKKDVGLRLAHTAMNVAYQKDVLPSGPVFEEMKRDGNRMILSFSGTGEGLSTLDKNKYGYVNGFAIAGDDQKFVWAKAYLHNNQVVVFSDEVQRPVAVRYGWANNPVEINLVNSDGLLASPFRTDTWKGITEGK
ncbi:sialate O-acetylesterase [Gaoshiqia sp. Z1-71]|uniref:sialate O-acetylesterase n=1 Tax=Gaoshiqia hydrogeniformans TaxID=3290090 RepID=UPI003BF8C511